MYLCTGRGVDSLYIYCRNIFKPSKIYPYLITLAPVSVSLYVSVSASTSACTSCRGGHSANEFR